MKLRSLSNEEIVVKLKNFHLLQRGESGLDASFSGYYFGPGNEGIPGEEDFIGHNIFRGLDLTGADFSNSEITYVSFEGTNLTGTDFRGSKFHAFINGNTVLNGADFRGAEYNLQDFNELQRDQIIFTNKDYEDYQKKLTEENRELKVITKNTSEKQTDKLVESFKALERTFLTEEIRWLIVAFVGFTCLMLLLAIPILDIFVYQYTYRIVFWGIIVIVGLIFTIATVSASSTVPKQENENDSLWKELWLFAKKGGWAILLYVLLVVVGLNSYLQELPTPTESVFHANKDLVLLPFGFLLITFLYFSVYQYSKSKRLRIENQNKVALLHGFIALRSDTGTDYSKEIFYSNIAGVVFDRIYQEKEINLPIDKLVDLANSLNKKS